MAGQEASGISSIAPITRTYDRRNTSCTTEWVHILQRQEEYAYGSEESASIDEMLITDASLGGARIS